MDERASGIGSPLRNIGLLAVAQAILGSNQAIIMSIASLTAATMVADKGFATVPVTLMIIGTALATGPAALLIHSLGRREGLMLGASIAIPAGLVAALSAWLDQFWLFCLALALFGIPAAFANQYRFAAADSVPPKLKSRAISWVLFGGVVAGFLGPQISAHTKGWVPGHEFAATYLVMGLLALLAIAVLSRTRLAPTVKRAEDRKAGRPLGVLLRDTGIWVPMLVAAASYSLMVLVMIAAPLAMVYVCGHTTEDAAFAIQWHIVAMFAPSFITGAIIHRIGARLTAAIGLLLILLAAGTNLHGTSTLHFDIALVLLGVGWNFGFIASTAMLAAAYRPEEAAKVQAANEQVVFGVMALASIASGLLLQLIGWEAINLLAIPVAAVAILALAWVSFRPGAAEGQPG
ncbi:MULTISPECIES: MFS transporter [unclassified Devosia]|jgi:predicted MFS family arabinose efflux permease|uniref:MFS transporter n=1 Tax=unclassified Devosia TaxID=196773 RepID=UPI000B0FE0C0|nr:MULTISPECIES: MFS transporter [unclassified Devosia]MBN9359980.1 MFS transporter [Devosia sp.]